MTKETPYGGPSLAVAQMLHSQGFDDKVMGVGLVDIRITAEFDGSKAMFREVQVLPSRRQAKPDTPSAPPTVGAGTRTMRRMAERFGTQRSHFTLQATVEELGILDRELEEATDEEITTLIEGTNRGHVLVKYDCARSGEIIDRLLAGYREGVPG